MTTLDQIRAFGRQCLQEAQKCREKDWPRDYEDSYLATAADIAGASDLELLESCI
jgi:hypothetical protein